VGAAILILREREAHIRSIMRQSGRCVKQVEPPSFAVCRAESGSDDSDQASKIVSDLLES
jgi:hypothetical protein